MKDRKLVMPKGDGRLELAIQSLKIYYDKNEWLSNDEFISLFLEQSSNYDGNTNTAMILHKARTARYFGLIKYLFKAQNDLSGRQGIITIYGKRFYEAYVSKNNEALIDTMIDSIQYYSFGRNNYATSDTDSNVEPPRVLLRAALDLEYITKTEFISLLYYMHDEDKKYADILNTIREKRKQGITLGLPQNLPDKEKSHYINVYGDWKFTQLLREVGIIEDNTDKVVVTQYVKNKYGKVLKNLKVTSDLLEEDIFVSQEKDYEIEQSEIMSLENREFIYKCLDIMKQNNLFTEYTLDVLTDKEQCAKLFNHNVLGGILKKMDSGTDENEQRKDENEYLRYYSDKYEIGSKDYFVSSQWDPNRERSRVPFVNWIKSLMQKIRFNTGYQSEFSCNRIIFGAPGTGKSYTLNRQKDELLKLDSSNYERVTFYPNYSYANFVGTYKPVSSKDLEGKDVIKYEYVPGPFMRVYVKALENSKHKENIKPFLLLIEEINRANVAAVFGEVFQLLDRNDNNVSEYTIQATEDVKNYLAKELKCSVADVAEIRIPDNMFIWATMNSADQGVFPMDTAFKRRWDFEYIGIDEEEAEVEKYIIPIADSEHRRYVKWNDLRKGINSILSSDDCKVNEDKLLGPFFISKNMLEHACENEDGFVKAFESKVIMYLFEDAMKMRPGNIFKGHKGKMIFSEICKTFEEKGEEVFGISDIEYLEKEEE